MTLFDFEYDEEKSRANKAKHGIDFEEAQALWEDPRAVNAPAMSETEARYLVTGRIEYRLWTAVATQRQGRIRIISTRRARAEEARTYGRQIHRR